MKPRPPGPVRRILVIRMGHIGDVVLVTPALDLLHQLFPEAEISLLVRAGTEAVLENHPFIKHIHAGGQITSNQRMHERTKPSLWARLRQAPRGLQLLRQLRRRHFDLVVDFSGGDRSALFTLFSGAAQRLGFEPRPGSWKRRVYTCAGPAVAPGTHKVEKDVALLRHFAKTLGYRTELAAGPLVMQPKPEDTDWARKRWQTVAGETGVRVLVHPTSRVLYKCWDNARWAAVIARIKAEFQAAVLVTSGPDAAERESARALLSLCDGNVPAQLGDIRIGQLAALAREADLFLGVDSAPMHIAAAVGTRVVAIFGPSQPEIWGPWSTRASVVRRPCSCLATGQRRCDEARGMDCLNQVTVEDVCQAIRSRLSKPAAGT